MDDDVLTEVKLVVFVVEFVIFVEVLEAFVVLV